ncbi:MAG: hypothetical protein ACRD07_18090 [Acidimicrobiales bacterium]
MVIVGVEAHRCLGIEDGTPAPQPDAVGVDTVTALIHEVAPHTIVTFGPATAYADVHDALPLFGRVPGVVA